MTTLLEMLRILREQTERMRIAAENLFTDIDKLHEFVDIQYELLLKRQGEADARRKRLTSGGFFSPSLDGVRKGGKRKK